MSPAIYTYTAGANGLFVNSYLVETDDGVVAIDGNLLVSDARAFRARNGRRRMARSGRRRPPTPPRW